MTLCLCDDAILCNDDLHFITFSFILVITLTLKFACGILSKVTCNIIEEDSNSQRGKGMRGPGFKSHGSLLHICNVLFV